MSPLGRGAAPTYLIAVFIPVPYGRVRLRYAPVLVFIDGDKIQDGFHNPAGLMAFGQRLTLANRPQGSRFNLRQSGRKGHDRGERGCIEFAQETGNILRRCGSRIAAWLRVFHAVLLHVASSIGFFRRRRLDADQCVTGLRPLFWSRSGGIDAEASLIRRQTLQTPVQIDFKGHEGSETQKAAIHEYLTELERMFDRIVAGRVAVTAPGKHHRGGEPYEISIWLKLPDGREVDVSRSPGVDERYADFKFALGDAFRRAQRQLRDQVERMQGEIKTAAVQPTGTVVRLLEDHGFLESPDGLEIYFHRNSVLNGGFAKLEPGMKVSFVESQGQKGPQASTVKLLGKHALR